MRKLICVVLCCALVCAMVTGVWVKPVKVKSAVETMLLEKEPKLDKVKLNWYQTKGAKKYVIYKADVTKIVKKGKVKLSKKKYKKLKTLSKKKLIFTDKKVKMNHYYAYYIKAYKIKKGKKKLLKTSYDKYFDPVFIGVDEPRLQLSSYEGEYDEEKCILFDIVLVDGVITNKFDVYRKGPGDKKFKKINVEIKQATVGDGDTFCCFDKNVVAKQVYQYKVKAYVVKGGKKIYSKFSKVSYQEV